MGVQRIAVSGSGGIGKSTLACQIAQITGYPLIPDLIDDVLREHGYGSWREVMSHNEAIQIRLEALARKIDCESKTPAFVSDKGVADYLAYWDLNASRFAPANTNEMFESSVRNHLRRYDVILLLVWGRMAVEHLARRNVDRRHQFLVHSTITRRLLEFRAPFVVFNQFTADLQDERALLAKLEAVQTPRTCRQIGLYIGTFDPPTIGHLTCAERASALLDEVWFCPNADNPNCARDHEPLTERACMLLLLSAGHTKLRVYCRDHNPYLASGPPHLIRSRKQLITEVQEKNRDVQFWIIMGSDKLATKAYEDPEPEIKEMGHLVFERSRQYDLDAMANLDLWIWLPSVGTVSSTEVKERLSKRQDTNGLLSPAVAAYVNERGLYGSRTENM